MCQAIAEGGRRCPRHRRDSIVAMQFASAESGLPLESINEIFTELRREGRHVTISGVEDSHEQVIFTLQEQARDGNVAQRYRDILSEFDEDPAPRPDTLYALTRLRRRSIDQATNLNDELGAIARQTQMSVVEVRDYYQQARSAASTSTAADEHDAADYNAATERDIPRDPASVTAYARTVENFSLGERGEALISAEDKVMFPESGQVPEAGDLTVIAGYGYHAESGRLEVYSFDGMTIPYRDVPVETVESWRNKEDAVDGINDIRYSNSHRYANLSEATQGGYAYRCAACGQFRALSHECPERDVIDQIMASDSTRSRESITAGEVQSVLADRAARLAAEETAAAAEVETSTDTSTEDTNPVLALQNGTTPAVDHTTGRGMRPVDPEASIAIPAEDQRDLLQRRMTHLRPLTKSEMLAEFDASVSRASRWGERFIVLPYSLTREQVAAAPDNSMFMNASMSQYSEEQSRCHFYVSQPYNGDTHTYVSTSRWGNQHRLSNNLAEGEGEVIPFRRRGIVNTTRYASRQECLDSARDAYQAYLLSNQDGIVQLDQTASLSRGYSIQSDHVSKIQWAKKPQFRRAINDGKIASAQIVWEEPRGGAQIDEFGYDIDNKGFYVYGELGMRRKEDGTFEVATPSTTLRCHCEVYARNYHCTHIDYVRNHAPKVGQQMMQTTVRQAPTPGVHGVPVSVSNHAGATVTRDAEADQTSVSFTASPAQQYRARQMRFSEATLEQDRDIITASRLAGLSNGTLYTPPPTIVNRAARNADTVSAPFHISGARDPLRSAYRYAQSYDLMGVRRLTRSAEGEVTQTVEQLRCTCGRFTSGDSPATCPHVELFTQHQDELLEVAPDFGYRDANLQRHRIQPYEQQEQLESYRSMYVSFANGEITQEELDARVAEAEAAIARQAAEYEERERQRRAERAAREEEERRRMALSMAERSAEESARFQAENPEYESYRSGQKELWQNVDERYGDNTEAVKQIIQEAQEQTGTIGEVVGFRTENVTDGVCDPNIPGSRRFGVELEFVLPENSRKHLVLNAIAEELHEAGLADRSTMGGYHSGQSSGWASWNLESDCTVDGELVSPLMADSPEHWEQLSKALEILKRHGAKTSTKAGSHVHVSSGSFGGKLAKGVEVLRTVEENEDILFRAAADPKTGAHRGTRWCAPNISTSHFGNVAKDDYDNTGRWGGAVLNDHLSHSNMLNFEGSVGMTKKAHIEYRLWDASLDAATIQKQVMASVAITEAADRDTEANDGVSPAREVSPEQKYGAAQRRLGKSKDVDEHSVKNLASFVDRVFRRKEDREDFIRLFATKSNA